MATKYYCDRCNSEHLRFEDNLTKVELPLLDYHRQPSGDTKNYDLCNNCVRHLLEAVTPIPKEK